MALRGRIISPVLLVSWWAQDLTCSQSGDITRQQAALSQALTELQLPGHILSWLSTGMVVLAAPASQLALANSIDRRQQAFVWLMTDPLNTLSGFSMGMTTQVTELHLHGC